MTPDDHIAQRVVGRTVSYEKKERACPMQAQRPTKHRMRPQEAMGQVDSNVSAKNESHQTVKYDFSTHRNVSIFPTRMR